MCESFRKLPAIGALTLFLFASVSAQEDPVSDGEILDTTIRYEEPEPEPARLGACRT
jgi:hypothetical protein